MSSFKEQFAQNAPARLDIPEPLLRAWDMMEAQGWGNVGAAGELFLTPYPGERQLGPVFRTDLTIRGWLNPAAPGAERLIPLAETDGSGSLALIWTDDAGEARFIGLSSDSGVALRLADTAVDFLRLVGIGYDDFEEYNFGEEPYVEDNENDDETNSVEALAAFRTWVESEFTVTVPALWEAEVDEQFGQWITPLAEQHGLG